MAAGGGLAVGEDGAAVVHAGVPCRRPGGVLERRPVVSCWLDWVLRDEAKRTSVSLAGLWWPEACGSGVQRLLVCWIHELSAPVSGGLRCLGVSLSPISLLSLFPKLYGSTITNMSRLSDET